MIVPNRVDPLGMKVPTDEQSGSGDCIHRHNLYCPRCWLSTSLTLLPAACCAPPRCSLPAASDNLRQSVWLSGTAGQGAAPLRLVVQEQGAAVILDADETPRWTTNTAPQQAVLMHRGAGDR